MEIFDIHTHAFPDFLAEKAIGVLSANSGVGPESAGTVSGLLELMDQYGINRAAIQSIATRPAQADNILQWSREIRTDRIIPFASVHPESEHIEKDIAQIADAGLLGIKLHPLYQEFNVDDPRVFPLYEAVAEAGLVLLCHAGLDIAFDQEDLAAPKRFKIVIEKFPSLKLVMAHFGGWKRVDQFIEYLCGLDVFIDTSFTHGFVTEDQIQTILDRHGADRIVFGSDSPWGKMAEQISFVNDMPITEEDKEKIFFRNAEELLGLEANPSD